MTLCRLQITTLRLVLQDENKKYHYTGYCGNIAEWL